MTRKKHRDAVAKQARVMGMSLDKKYKKLLCDGALNVHTDLRPSTKSYT